MNMLRAKFYRLLALLFLGVAPALCNSYNYDRSTQFSMKRIASILGRNTATHL